MKATLLYCLDLAERCANSARAARFSSALVGHMNQASRQESGEREAGGGHGRGGGGDRGGKGRGMRGGYAGVPSWSMNGTGSRRGTSGNLHMLSTDFTLNPSPTYSPTLPSVSTPTSQTYLDTPLVKVGFQKRPALA